MRTKFINKKIVIIILLLEILSIIAIAEPNGAETIETISSSRGAAIAAKTVSAQAGNITELSINATSITKAWQGYYGNISGTITMDDANNWTLYDWKMATASGKIFSTRNDTGINWNTIACANDGNISAEDAFMLNTGMADSINETFTGLSSSFFVGNTLLNNCPRANTYVNDSAQTGLFQEAIIMDTSKNSLIFTALVENKQVGFDNRSHDFQMIVPEYGRNGDTATTLYYFYVELN